MEERTGAQLELQSTAGELARREERLVGRLDEVATLLDGVSGKVDALVAIHLPIPFRVPPPCALPQS